MILEASKFMTVYKGRKRESELDETFSHEVQCAMGNVQCLCVKEREGGQNRGK